MTSSIQSLTSLSSFAQPHLIPRIGICLHGVFTKKYSLCGRININWRDMIMVVGIATAVTGLCLAIFYKMAMAAWGFALVGIVQGFAARYVHKYQTLKDLEGVVTRLTALNNDLNQAKLRLENATTALNAENQKLAAATRDLERNNGNLATTNRDLTQNNLQLLSTVDTIRGRLLEFGEQNLAFRNQNGALGTNAQRFQDLYGLYDSSLGSMQTLVNTTRQLAEENLHKIAEERQKDRQYLGEEIKKLKGVIDGNNTLADKLIVLEKYEKNIKEHEQNLEKIKLEHMKISTWLIRDREELEKTRVALNQETAALTQTRIGLQQDAHNLHQASSLATTQLTNLSTNNFSIQIPIARDTVTV